MIYIRKEEVPYEKYKTDWQAQERVGGARYGNEFFERDPDSVLRKQGKL